MKTTRGTRGKGAEAEILRAAALHYPAPECLLVHLPVATREVAPGKLVRVRVSPFDFMGSVRGRALAIECKSSEGARLPEHLLITEGDEFGIKRHQILALTDWHLAGGLSMVLWKRGPDWLRLDGDQLVEASLASAHEERTKIDVDAFTLLEAHPFGPPFLASVSVKARQAASPLRKDS